MVLLMIGACGLFLLAAFAGPRVWLALTVLVVGLAMVVWLSENVVTNLILLVFRAQSEDADVLRWACPWTPNGGTCIFKPRGLGRGAIAVPLALGCGVVVRRRREAAAVPIA